MNRLIRGGLVGLVVLASNSARPMEMATAVEAWLTADDVAILMSWWQQQVPSAVDDEDASPVAPPAYEGFSSQHSDISHDRVTWDDAAGTMFAGSQEDFQAWSGKAVRAHSQFNTLSLIVQAAQSFYWHGETGPNPFSGNIVAQGAVAARVRCFLECLLRRDSDSLRYAIEKSAQDGFLRMQEVDALMHTIQEIFSALAAGCASRNNIFKAHIEQLGMQALLPNFLLVALFPEQLQRRRESDYVDGCTTGCVSGCICCSGLSASLWYLLGCLAL